MLHLEIGVPEFEILAPISHLPTRCFFVASVMFHIYIGYHPSFCRLKIELPVCFFCCFWISVNCSFNKQVHAGLSYFQIFTLKLFDCISVSGATQGIMTLACFYPGCQSQAERKMLPWVALYSGTQGRDRFLLRLVCSSSV